MSHTRVLLIESAQFSHFVENIIHKTSTHLVIVGCATDAVEALELIRTQQPDVVLIDLCSNSSQCLEIITKIRARYPRLQIIGRLSLPNTGCFRPAIRAGVTGFINDQTSLAELREAIRTVRQGFAYLPPNLARQFVLGLQRQPI
jgi:DNA-binding NarL/FixJ family response regulator